MTQLTEITDYMQHALAKDNTGHSVDHINRVVALANQILIHEPSANQFIVRAAALLHDVYDDKLFTTEAEALAAKKLNHFFASYSSFTCRNH
ncbi:hypothetical protein GCM10025884_12860 [Leuconostoc gelidum subsp. gelidum]|nr:hypothetical protein GCM10025884_12860 [Leuconostoc gelidum subsp. gelidum]